MAPLALPGSSDLTGGLPALVLLMPGVFSKQFRLFASGGFVKEALLEWTVGRLVSSVSSLAGLSIMRSLNLGLPGFMPLYLFYGLNTSMMNYYSSLSA